jgi:hypothetical protein
MKMGVATIKSIAGLFLEGLMLVFIFVCSQSDFTANDACNTDAPLGKLTAFHQVAFRMTLCTESIVPVVSRHTVASANFTFPLIDLQCLKATLSDALIISPSERNSFYVLLRDNAP